MSAAWDLAVAVVTVLAGTLASAGLGDLISEEIRGRLDQIPHILLRLAARRLPLDVRQDLHEEWAGELHEILRGAEALPVTRLAVGTRYALGLLCTAGSIGRQLCGQQSAGDADDRRHAIVGQYLDHEDVCKCGHSVRDHNMLAQCTAKTTVVPGGLRFAPCPCIHFEPPQKK